MEDIPWAYKRPVGRSSRIDGGVNLSRYEVNHPPYTNLLDAADGIIDRT